MAQTAYRSEHVIAEARRLLSDAAARCQSRDRANETNVHEVRKDLKKVRAYWRLMWYALGRRASRDGNRRCARAAKRLSAARDHVVMLGALQAIGEQAGAQTASAVDVAWRAVHTDAGGPPTDAIDWDAVEKLIHADDAAWAALDTSSIPAGDIKRGWQRTRRKARRHFRAARGGTDAHALHAWRKWVKRELEQEQLLHAGKAKRIGYLDRLGELLGTHHDLSVLARRIKRSEHINGKPQQRVRRSIGRRQATLEREAMKIGRKAFA